MPLFSQPASTFAVEQFDVASYLSFLEGDMELASELLEVYFASGDTLLADIQQACHQGEWDDVHRLAHGFKGSSATIHASQCQQLALGLEQAARDGQLDSVPRLMDELVCAYQHLKCVINGQ